MHRWSTAWAHRCLKKVRQCLAFAQYRLKISPKLGFYAHLGKDCGFHHPLVWQTCCAVKGASVPKGWSVIAWGASVVSQREWLWPGLRHGAHMDGGMGGQALSASKCAECRSGLRSFAIHSQAPRKMPDTYPKRGYDPGGRACSARHIRGGAVRDSTPLNAKTRPEPGSVKLRKHQGAA
jgi:hypothetical protein